MAEQIKDITLEKKPDIYTDTGKFRAIVKEVVVEALREERENTRSFWRAVFNAFLSGVQNGTAQAGAELKRLFKE